MYIVSEGDVGWIKPASFEKLSPIRVSKTIVSRREGREQKRRQRTAESRLHGCSRRWIMARRHQTMAYQTGFQPRHCVKRGPVKMIIFYSLKTDNTERRTII
jgi:hypothetical protein